MPMEDNEAVYEKLGETEKRFGLLRDRFRLSVIAISEAEAKKQGLEIAESVVACISDLAFKFTAEVLANDVGLFAQHAGRKSINMEDVILSGEHIGMNTCLVC
ncbi:uncharacterized protein LOC110018309 isoform X6 [Phalaenopsis equestris]|uniref:uncharacterized protein LOC110018309 isoform X5 n=1 Tax=Phalaenopsis equestris TaxID=78828 RepID=UPI0009E542E3|nr:uncharacterized protein LOC110018309 isoform X5 [Phalaenopsis equestris]XP_020571248.1 uncharacterized protein LOC110018309 isoform X6 [Phalaenopsis equestris]